MYGEKEKDKPFEFVLYVLVALYRGQVVVA
jgi:hypothetical protein